LKIKKSKFRTKIEKNLKPFVFVSSFWFLIFAFCFLHFPFFCFAQDAPKQPITINGDNVEYSADSKLVTASGNVSIIYKDAKLTCEKITVNTETKDAVATGNAKLEDKRGIIEGKSIKYNFQNKTGMIIDPEFMSNPYFGKAEKADKVSEAELIAYRGYFTTCSYDRPHYRIKTKKIDMFPGEKILAKDLLFTLGQSKQVPLFYLPKFSQDLRDKFWHVQVMPGKRKDWGPYLLSAWRYDLADNVKGRIFFDERSKLGPAEGFSLNYSTAKFGKGDFKYYYTQERSPEYLEGQPAEFERYLIRFRHKWDIDQRTNLVSEYYKITDSKRAIYGSEHNFLKDYFPREYDKDAAPISYTQIHRSFNYSSLDLLLQKRTNSWYPPPQLEKLPEIKYSLPSLQVGETPFYVESNSSAGNYNKKNTSTSTPAANDTNPDVHVNRLDTTNKFSLPMKIAFIQFTPFVSNRETFYDADAGGSSIAPRTVFYSGADMSTKFFRIFNVRSGFLGLDINGLRHIITPSVGYAFNHEPSIANTRLKQIDDVDSVSRSNSASLSLSNKLQTKRNNLSVDLADFIITSTYSFKPKTGEKRGSSLSDVLFNLKVLPYSWMTVNSDATYKHSGLRSDSAYNHFTNANLDVNFNFSPERSIGIGERYLRKGGKETTFQSTWRLTPKWKLLIYERYQLAKVSSIISRGVREQRYTIARDLHCWDMEFSYGVEGGKGASVWLVFRLKAFPELGFDFNKNYNSPKQGTQGYQ